MCLLDAPAGLHFPADAFSVRVSPWLCRRLHTSWLVPTFGHQANRCCMCETDSLHEDPAAELLSEHHPKKTEQSHDGRSRALNPDDSIQNTDKQAHRK